MTILSLLTSFVLPIACSSKPEVINQATTVQDTIVLLDTDTTEKKLSQNRL